MNTPLSIDLDDLVITPDVWEPFRDGIEVHWFYRNGEDGSSAALLKYAPGASVPRHTHVGFEHILVLQGVQEDENGIHPAGELTINPPGSAHSVTSASGCIVYVVWEHPVVF